MKNLTLTLSESTHADLRVEAAKAGKSMSKFVSDLVEDRIGGRQARIEAMRRFLEPPYWDLTDENGNAPTRDQIYDRD